MKDLSREERIEQLEKLISEKDDFFDKEQGKRVKRTFFVLCGVIYLILLYWALKNGLSLSGLGNISNLNIENIFYLLFVLTVGVGFLAGLILFISFGVCYYIMSGAIRRTETLAELKGRLYELKYGKHKEE